MLVRRRKYINGNFVFLEGLVFPAPPAIPGLDVAGVVVAVGSSAPFAIGDRVMTMLSYKRAGGLAEYVACDASTVVHMPGALIDTNANCGTTTPVRSFTTPH